MVGAVADRSALGTGLTDGTTGPAPRRSRNRPASSDDHRESPSHRRGSGARTGSTVVRLRPEESPRRRVPWASSCPHPPRSLSDPTGCPRRCGRSAHAVGEELPGRPGPAGRRTAVRAGRAARGRPGLRRVLSGQLGGLPAQRHPRCRGGSAPPAEAVPAHRGRRAERAGGRGAGDRAGHRRSGPGVLGSTGPGDHSGRLRRHPDPLLHRPQAPAGDRPGRGRQRLPAARHRRRRRGRRARSASGSCWSPRSAHSSWWPASATPSWSRSAPKPGTRRSLDHYSLSYLRFVWILAAVLVVTCYSLWAFENRGEPAARRTVDGDLHRPVHPGHAAVRTRGGRRSGRRARGRRAARPRTARIGSDLVGHHLDRGVRPWDPSMNELDFPHEETRIVPSPPTRPSCRCRRAGGAARLGADRQHPVPARSDRQRRRRRLRAAQRRRPRRRAPRARSQLRRRSPECRRDDAGPDPPRQDPARRRASPRSRR